ncbi:hypothetical protein [Pseudonocardia humida]|uniref:Serine/threonine protein kinase n=1 Tax=Pseudonocardia humida TaxID=2800819 RepID=A0ABT1A9P2_9PSEU|nr:hypothetical protein [Pseudonocardia humida]MCO1659658.1 hypothetical protein [Pseudonocardia humida]
MKRYAPLLTLLAVAVLGLGLLAVNVAGEPDGSAAPAAAAAAAPAETTAPAPPAPAPTTEPAAPPAPEPPAVAEKAYAGRSSGDEVTVAVAVKDGRAVGYVCDGEEIEAWLEGTVEGDTIALRSGDGEVGVAGNLDEDAAFGDVTVNGQSWPFSAKAVQEPGGLYEGRGDVRGVATRIGWIVEGDGRVTGLARSAGSAAPQPAPPLDPNAPDRVVVDGAPITVTTIDGGDVVVGR